MTTNNDTKKLPATHLLTVEARLSFPALFQPKPRTKEVEYDKDGKPIPPELYYQATLLFPPGTDFAPFKAAMKAAMVAKGWDPATTKLPAAKNPLKDAGEKSNLAGYLEGWTYINTSSKRRPGLVDRMGVPITEAQADRIYPGVWVRAYLGAFAYAHSVGGKGISFGLNALQVVRDDERFDGFVATGDVFTPLDTPVTGAEGTSGSMFD